MIVAKLDVVAPPPTAYSRRRPPPAARRLIMSDPITESDDEVDVEQGAAVAQAADTETHVKKRHVISAIIHICQFVADPKSCNCKVSSPGSRPPEPRCPQCGDRLVEGAARE